MAILSLYYFLSFCLLLHLQINLDSVQLGPRLLKASSSDFFSFTPSSSLPLHKSTYWQLFLCQHVFDCHSYFLLFLHRFLFSSYLHKYDFFGLVLFYYVLSIKFILILFIYHLTFFHSLPDSFFSRPSHFHISRIFICCFSFFS